MKYKMIDPLSRADRITLLDATVTSWDERDPRSPNPAPASFTHVLALQDSHDEWTVLFAGNQEVELVESGTATGTVFEWTTHAVQFRFEMVRPLAAEDMT